MSASRERFENRGALLWRAAIFSPLMLPVLFPLVEVLTGQTGFVVLLIVLAIPAGWAESRMLPYLQDLFAEPDTVGGGVTEKRQVRSYVGMPRYEVVLDSGSGDVAALALGAAVHDSSAGQAPPDFITVNLPGPEPASLGGLSHSRPIVVGGPHIENERRDAVANVRQEMNLNRFEVSAQAFDRIQEGDQLRIYVYRRSSVTAGVERLDSRVNRYVAL